MKTPKKLMDLDRLVNLFFAFVLGTISFVILAFVSLPAYHWKEEVRLALLLVGVFSYEAVIVALISYYISKATSKVAEIFEKNPQLIYWLTIALLAGTYLMLDTIKEKSWLIFFRDLIMVGLIVVGLPKVNKFFEKKDENK